MQLLAMLSKCKRQIFLIICVVSFALILHQKETIKRWGNYFFDAELIALPERPASNDIVIIAIDDFSLKQLGKWPWSRDIHAQLVNLLTAANVKAVGLDIIFAEPDQNNPASDQALVEAVKNNGRVVLPVLPDRKPDGSLDVTLPMPALREVAAGLGHVDTGMDSDGIIRSAYLMAGQKDKLWPALALALINVNTTDIQPYLKGVRNPENDAPASFWRRDFRIELPFLPANSHFKQISYAEMLSNPDILREVAGKYILVGTTAAGLSHMFMTPLHKNSSLVSGIELHAGILDTLLSGSAIEPINPLHSLFLTAALVALPLIGYNFFFCTQALPISVVFAGLALAISTLLLRNFFLWFNPLPVLLPLTGAYVFWDWQRIHFFTQSLFKERQLAKAALHSIADAVITTKPWGIIIYLNPAAEKLSGFSLQQAIGLHINSVIRLAELRAGSEEFGFDSLIARLSAGDTMKEFGPKHIINSAGEERAVKISASPIRNNSGQIISIVFAFTDITETLQISHKMTYLATHDALTGLANRTLFYEQIEKAIATCKRQNNNLALLFIDLDDFKKVNDGLGHAAGDAVLIETAARLKANIRQADTVARWGGDEFIVLLNQLPHEENTTYAISKVTEQLSRPYIIDGHTLYITPSIGISLYPKDGLTAEDLLANADAAMFQVKQNGRNNFGFFSDSHDKASKYRLNMETELYSALAEGHFEIYYQPQLDLKTNSITAAEALLRWNHPKQGIISPDNFIPLAEATGLINPIGDWVIQTVCRQISLWQKLALPEICVSVNLSPHQFLQSNLCEKIRAALKNNRIHAHYLKIEITESLMIKNVQNAVKMLWDIRALGVGVSIDDFGTGYSSLSMLKNFPIDQLKIDKSFIGPLTSNSDTANIVQTIILLGHNMGMKVVAEGVENREQYELLKNWKCDFVQGYYFNRPLTASQLVNLMQETHLKCS